MRIFGRLYGFELKKLWKKKMVRVTLMVMLAVIITGNLSNMMITTLTDEEVEISAYADILEKREYARRLTGRYIDDTLIKEMQRAYGDSRVTYYEENHRKYEAIYSFVASISDYEDVLTVDEETLYQIRQDEIMQDLVSGFSLSEAEKALWEEREEKVQKPFVYEYSIGFSMLLGQINMIGYLWILLCAICLSGFFADEHLRRTDQVILCSRYGKRQVYFAKIAAGVTFSLSGTLLFFLIGTFFSIGIYGAEGFHAAIQLYIWMSSWSISIGEAVCILFLVSLCGVVCCSAFTMMLSELMRSAPAVLSLICGIMIFTLFVNVPSGYRVLSQMYALIPTKLINEMGFLDNRMIHVFGKYVSNLQAAPVVYLVLAAGFVWIGYVGYGRYQVKGR